MADRRDFYDFGNAPEGSYRGVIRNVIYDPEYPHRDFDTNQIVPGPGYVLDLDLWDRQGKHHRMKAYGMKPSRAPNSHWFRLVTELLGEFPEYPAGWDDMYPEEREAKYTPEQQRSFSSTQAIIGRKITCKVEMTSTGRPGVPAKGIRVYDESLLGEWSPPVGKEVPSQAPPASSKRRKSSPKQAPESEPESEEEEEEEAPMVTPGSPVRKKRGRPSQPVLEPREEDDEEWDDAEDPEPTSSPAEKDAVQNDRLRRLASLRTRMKGGTT